MKTSAGIYIHTPFCAVKCMYCDFYSITNREEVIPRFVKAIITKTTRVLDLARSKESRNWAVGSYHLTE